MLAFSIRLTGKQFNPETNQPVVRIEYEVANQVIVPVVGIHSFVGISSDGIADSHCKYCGELPESPMHEYPPHRYFGPPSRSTPCQLCQHSFTAGYHP